MKCLFNGHSYLFSLFLFVVAQLWDIRRKGCIFTYKGHTNGINCLRFSPDGRWIASAGEDGTLKVDLNSILLLPKQNKNIT